ncbi:MAG: tRNA dihydrouridine synthase DusB [Candidatus Riflebacteria bacterium]|nr:tRNA dihydrouridine synthase DusB [Candidatus Riflebacteria bacterium]
MPSDSSPSSQPAWLENPALPFDKTFQIPSPDSALAGIVKPVQIGGVQLPNNLVLAPMAGVTDGSFRLLCSRMGVGFTVSELASARAITYRSRQTIDMVRFQAQARPYAVQLFGSDPEIMARAAAFIEELQICDIIDINMGCPVAKVVKTGAGSALMKTPALAAEIIRQVKKAVKVPVTAKFRIGWTENTINVKEFTRTVIDAGAQAITVHARTRQAGYTGTAQWQHLEGIKELCGTVPFFANGDISCPEHLIELSQRTGCDGFMIGRGCVGKPWLFSQLLGNNDFAAPALRFRIFRHHLIDMLMEHGPSAVPLFRVHLFGYLKNHPHSAKLRHSLCNERNPDTVIAAGRDFFSAALQTDAAD